MIRNPNEARGSRPSYAHIFLRHGAQGGAEGVGAYFAIDHVIHSQVNLGNFLIFSGGTILGIEALANGFFGLLELGIVTFGSRRNRTN